MDARGHAPAPKFLRPAAGRLRSPPGTREQCGAPGRPHSGPGRNGRPFSARVREQKAPPGPRRAPGGGGGSAGPGRRRENFLKGRGGGATAPGALSRSGVPHNSRAERGKAGPPRPRPSRTRARPRPAAYLVVLLPAARGRRRRPARAARHVHVQGAGERAPQRPHPPRQPHGRQAQAQPAHEQSHRGPRPLVRITAGAGARRRRRRRLRPPPPPPGLEPSRPTCPSSPFRAEAGGGEERAAHSLPASPFLSARGTPPPPAPVSTRST